MKTLPSTVLKIVDTHVWCNDCGTPLRGTEITYVARRTLCYKCAPSAPLWWDDSSYARYQADCGECPRCGRDECGDPELRPCTLWAGGLIESLDFRDHHSSYWGDEPPF